MPVPSPRNKILPARGDFADLQAALGDLVEGEICYAFDQDQYYQKEGGVLVAVGATKAQGLLAESALQAGDNISELINDMGYLTAGDIVDAPVQSVNGKTGAVVLNYDDVGAPSDSEFATLEGRVLNSETDISNIETALPNKADLVNGVVPNSQLPSVAITEYLGQAADEAEMLALDGQKGDWAIRTDTSTTWVVTGEDSSQLASWTELATPPAGVSSVNGYTGTVVLSAADVGAAPSTVNLQAVTDNGSITTNGAEFGGGNITLNSNGSAKFNTNDDPVLDLYRATTSIGGGVFRLYSDVGDTKRRSFAITADGTTSIGGVDNSGSPNITLNANGRIDQTRAGGDTAALSQYFNGDNGNLVGVHNVGAFYLGTDINGSSPSTTSNITLLSGGVLKVSEPVNNVTAGLCRTNSGTTYGLTIAPADNENNFTASITADGSARFAGDVTSGVATGDVANRQGWLFGNIGFGASWNKNDGIYTWYGQKDTVNDTLVGFATGTSTNIAAANARINADGSAVLAAGGVKVSNGLSAGEGKIEVYRSHADARDLLTMGKATNDIRFLFQSDGTLALSDTNLGSVNEANVQIQGDGSGSFVGTVTAAQIVADSTGGQITSAYNVVTSSTNANHGLFIGTTDSGNATTANSGASILGNGNANFSGKVETVGDTAAFHVGTDKDSGKVPFNIYDTANANATLARITGDGSAQFAQTVSTGGTAGATAANYGFIGFSNAPGPLNNADGTETYATVYARNLDGGLAYVWKGADENANITSWIRNNGDCGFTGYVVVDRDANKDSSTACVVVDSGGDNVARINDDGSATFANRVDIGSNALNNNVALKLENNSDLSASLYVQQYHPSGDVFSGRDSSNNETSKIAANGSGWLAYNNISWDISGNMTVAGQINGTTVGTSDERFKENIAPANPQLDDVVALGGMLKNFDWNEDAPVNEEIRATRQLGLIAQEAEEVCPSLIKTISRTKQGEELTPAELDEEGNEITPATYEELDDSYKGISHDALVMKLLGAVAELTARVEELERELHA